MKNFFLGLFAAVILITAGYYSYLYGKKTNTPVAITPTPIVTPVITIQPTTGIPDSDLIKAALYKKNNWLADSVTVVVSQNDGKYAKGTANGKDGGGGGYFFAEKSADGVWEIVADGNGIITCASVLKYPDYPKSLIPSCYDEKSGTVITR